LGFLILSKRNTLEMNVFQTVGWGPGFITVVLCRGFAWHVITSLNMVGKSTLGVF
jgi:hypothetical protein